MFTNCIFPPTLTKEYSEVLYFVQPIVCSVELNMLHEFISFLSLLHLVAGTEFFYDIDITSSIYCLQHDFLVDMTHPSSCEGVSRSSSSCEGVSTSCVGCLSIIHIMTVFSPETKNLLLLYYEMKKAK